jgi:hypothetical protein
MSAVLLHLRAELRRRWPALLGAIALVGLVGGLVLASLAGARRTDTAFDRMLTATDAWDVVTNPDEGTDSELRYEQVRDLPMVDRAVRAMGVAAVPADADGTPVEDEAISLAAGDPEAFVELARPKVLEGRLYDTTAPDEIMVTADVAERFGYEAGERTTLARIGSAGFREWQEAGFAGPPPFELREFTVAGIVLLPDGVTDDELFDFGTILLTNAYWQEDTEQAYYFGIAVDLVDRPGVVADYQRAVRELVPGEAVEFQTMAALRERVDRGTRPHVIALLAFAAVVGGAGLLVASQTTNRQLAPLARDAATLGSVGLRRRTLIGGAALRVALLAIGGALVAVVVAILLSPIFPLGVARQAEVSPGIEVNAALLAGGALALVLLLVLGALRAVWRVVRPALPAARRLAVTRRLDAAALPPVPAIGLRMALAEPQRASPVSIRATVAGLAAATAAVVATGTFGSNLATFVDTPRAYGWGWDAMVTLNNEADPATVEGQVERFTERDEFTAVTEGTSDQLQIDGRRIPAVGFTSIRGTTGLPVVAGREPAADDEIALGGRKLAELGVEIGDQVLVGEGALARELEVVGQPVFIGIGTYTGADRTELGKGALLPTATLAELGEGFQAPFVLLDAPDETILQQGLDGALVGLEPQLADGRIEVLTDPLRPADVGNLERVRSTPIVISGVLVVLAAAAFFLALRSAARARRRDLALLKTLGMPRRDLASAVAIQASTLALLAVAVGLPLGVVVGRWTWTLLAERLGIVPSPGTPLLLIVLVVPAALLLANVAALSPALAAARVPAAAVLRSE